MTSQHPAVEKMRLEATHFPFWSMASSALARNADAVQPVWQIAVMPNGRVIHGILMTQPRVW